MILGNSKVIFREMIIMYVLSLSWEVLFMYDYWL